MREMAVAHIERCFNNEIHCCYIRFQDEIWVRVSLITGLEPSIDLFWCLPWSVRSLCELWPFFPDLECGSDEARA